MKDYLRALLSQGRLSDIAGLAEEKKRVLGSLVSLTYDSDEGVAWRAVEAVGLAADRVAEKNPAYVREHLRRLHWLLNEESGGICWRGPETMAEIVRRRPEMFSDYVPIVGHLLVEMAEEDLEHFRAGILWAVGRMGSGAREAVADVLPEVVSALDHEDSQIRGLAVWCLGRLGCVEVLSGRNRLLDDEGPVEIYEDGDLRRSAVRELTMRALSSPPSGG